MKSYHTVIACLFVVGMSAQKVQKIAYYDQDSIINNPPFNIMIVDSMDRYEQRMFHQFSRLDSMVQADSILLGADSVNMSQEKLALAKLHYQLVKDNRDAFQEYAATESILIKGYLEKALRNSIHEKALAVVKKNKYKEIYSSWDSAKEAGLGKINVEFVNITNQVWEECVLPK
jgi:hypothetical protein